MKRSLIFLLFSGLFIFSQCNNDNSVQLNSIAGDIEGTYMGMLAQVQQNIQEANHSIEVGIVNDTTIQVSPTASGSVTTQAVLREGAVSGTFILVNPENPSFMAGTYVPQTQKISYSYHLGGDQNNVEVYLGEKQ